MKRTPGRRGRRAPHRCCARRGAGGARTPSCKTRWRRRRARAAPAIRTLARTGRCPTATPTSRTRRPTPGRSSLEAQPQHVTAAHRRAAVPSVLLPVRRRRRAAWFSMVGNPDAERVGKIDATTGPAHRPLRAPAGRRRDTERRLQRPRPRRPASSSARATTVSVYTDCDERRAFFNDAKKLLSFTAPPSALCGADDSIVGIILTWDGHVAFATRTASSASSPMIRRRWTRSTCGP